MSRKSALARAGKLIHENPETPGEYQTSREPLDLSQNAFPTLVRERETTTLRVCEGCGIDFEPQRKHQKFHSPKCRKDHWEKRNRPALSNAASKRLEVSTPLFKEYLKAVGAAICGFCQRLTKVDVERGGEQRARCRCGARWFRRRRRGHLERGWKRGNKQVLYQ